MQKYKLPTEMKRHHLQRFEKSPKHEAPSRA